MNPDDIYNIIVEFHRQTEIDRILEKHYYAGYGTPKSNNRCACGYLWPLGQSFAPYIEDELVKLNKYWDSRRKPEEVK